MIDLLDIMADEVIEHPMFDVIPQIMSRQEGLEEIMRDDPNQFIMISLAGNADYLDPDQHSRWHRGFVNLLRWFAVEYVEEPYLNSRLGWVYWAIGCHSRDDAYYPALYRAHHDIPAWVIPKGVAPVMVFGKHYEPRKWYRKGEPIRPPEAIDLNDPFDLHPDKMKVLKEEHDRELKERMEKYVDAGSPGSERFGFNSDIWRGYFTIRGSDCYLCSIRSLAPDQGNFTKLLLRIKTEGFVPKIVNPVKRLEIILIRKGYVPTVELLAGDDAIVWRESKEN